MDISSSSNLIALVKYHRWRCWLFALISRPTLQTSDNRKSGGGASWSSRTRSGCGWGGSPWLAASSARGAQGWELWVSPDFVSLVILWDNWEIVMNMPRDVSQNVLSVTSNIGQTNFTPLRNSLGSNVSRKTLSWSLQGVNCQNLIAFTSFIKTYLFQHTMHLYNYRYPNGCKVSTYLSLIVVPNYWVGVSPCPRS